MTQTQLEHVDAAVAPEGEKTLDQQIASAREENDRLTEKDEKVTATLAAKIFAEEMMFVPIVETEQEALKKVTDMRVRLWERLKSEAGLDFPKPNVNVDSIHELDDAFSKDVFQYFIERNYIAIDGTDERGGRFSIYQNMYPVARVEEPEKSRLGAFFTDWQDLFPENDWSDHQAAIVYGGEGMGSDFFYEIAEGMLGGMHKYDYVLVLQEKKERRANTLANEMGHVFFEKAMGFSPDDYQKTFSYDGKEYTIHQLAELVSSISEMRYGDDIDAAIGSISNIRDAYILSVDMREKYNQSGMSGEEVLIKIEQEAFGNIYSLAKKAVNTERQVG